LKPYLESFVEDKQIFASLALQSVYFIQSEDQKIPSFGTVASLAEETAASLAAYYQKMLEEDQVDIFFLGDVNEAEL
ncbi:EF-P 5-aminopentanol modification-associated protein YfmF, partial [Enterococcus faecalis]